jgi:hypothetical protein
VAPLGKDLLNEALDPNAVGDSQRPRLQGRLAASPEIHESKPGLQTIRALANIRESLGNAGSASAEAPGLPAIPGHRAPPSQLFHASACSSDLSSAALFFTFRAPSRRKRPCNRPFEIVLHELSSSSRRATLACGGCIPVRRRRVGD